MERKTKLSCLAAAPISLTLFWILLGLISCLRLLLTSDLALTVNFSPHDDLLYASRAYHLLLGEAFGPYDSRLFSKVPGLSLWIAVIRYLGIPYLFSTHLLYLVAGILFVLALLRCGISRAMCLLVFSLYALNPVGFDWQWFRVLREPVSTPLLLLFFAGQIFILCSIKERSFPLLPALLLSIVFALSLLLREEDKILYFSFALFAVVMAWKTFSQKERTKAVWLKFAVIVTLPVLFAQVAQWGLRSFVQKHYGLPLLYEMNEGEYPKLVAAIRSINIGKENRYVMIKQGVLSRLSDAFPRIRPLFTILPAPGSDNESCGRFAVCREWANGWMIFWLKDAIHFSGIVSDMASSQQFFSDLRLDIENACAQGTFQCTPRGKGLFPPFKLKWFRPWVQEWIDILYKMTQAPLRLQEAVPPVYATDVEVGRKFQLSTMTHHYDSLASSEANEESHWQTYSRERYRALKYWISHPEAAASKSVVEDDRAAFGARSLRVFKTPFGAWRKTIKDGYQALVLPMQLLGLIAMFLLFIWWQVPMTPLHIVALLFLALTLARSLIMAYVAIFIGHLDTRLFFSTYVLLMVFSPLLIYEAYRYAKLQKR